MMSSAAGALACGFASALAGWFLVPWLADVVLKRAYRRSHTWWWESLACYREFKRAHPQREPSSRAPGSEGSLGLWRAQAMGAARAGTLPRERVRALVEAGCAVDAEAAQRTEAEQRDRCSFRAKPWQRALCAIGCAAGGALAFVTGSWLPGAALAVATTAMTVAVVCDLRARMVPLETCAVLALAGVAFQGSLVGVEGALAGGAFAAVVVAGCWAVNGLFGRTGNAPVGYGDVRCMAALSLASGFATPLGIAACYGSAAVFSLGGIAMRRLSFKSGIPMAPFLALWLLFGAGACMYAQ